MNIKIFLDIINYQTFFIFNSLILKNNAIFIYFSEVHWYKRNVNFNSYIIIPKI